MKMPCGFFCFVRFYAFESKVIAFTLSFDSFHAVKA